MAVHLVLKEKSTGMLFGGAKLLDVDNVLCQYMGVDPDPVHWYMKWVNSVGMSLAFGRSFDEIRGDFDDPEMIRIINWVEEHFENASNRGR